MLTHDTPKIPPHQSQVLEQPSTVPQQDLECPLNLQDSTPLICRRPVRVAIYLFLAAFVLWMVAWAVVPRWLDPTFEQHIKEKNVMVGMTREQVMEAWGSPYQMNVSYTDKGIRREEWVYEDWLDSSTIKHRYLYFEEGRLVGGWH